MPQLFLRRSALALAAALVAAAPSLSQSQSRDDFFRGKEIQLLISHPAGGGYDTYARFLARQLPRFIEGRPAVVAQNMPGAAGVVMGNAMATQTRNDGTVIALGPGSLALADAFGGAGARYDAAAFAWIGSMNADVGVSLASSTSPVKTAADLLTHELIIGGGAVTDQSVVFPAALNRVLGTKFKIVSGYPGSAAITLALDRGEIQGIGGLNYSSVVANKPEWLRDKLVTVLVQLALERHPDLPDTPTVLELARNERERAILELVFAQADISRVVFGPPGMAPARLEILRAAFDRMVADREFLAEADKLKIEINRPMSGKAVSELVRKLRATSPELIKAAADAVRASP